MATFSPNLEIFCIDETLAQKKEREREKRRRKIDLKMYCVNKCIFWFIQFVWWDRNIRFVRFVFEGHNPDDEIPRRISLQDYNWQNQFFVTPLAILRGSVTRLQLVAASLFPDYIGTKFGDNRYIVSIGVHKLLWPEGQTLLLSATF